LPNTYVFGFVEINSCEAHTIIKRILKSEAEFFYPYYEILYRSFKFLLKPISRPLGYQGVKQNGKD